MFKKTLFLFLLLIIIGTTGFLIARERNSALETLNSQEMNQRIIKERDFAIQKAVEAGDYRCCIEPPCAMCYTKANQWNNFTATTCACDDLIVQGKEACPQCKRDICNGEKEGTCEIDIDYRR